MADRTFLDRVYDLDGATATRSFYGDWADSYDAEVTDAGYQTPARAAAALAGHLDPASAILDLGCGTGLSGQALTDAGFTTVDGCDLTPEMLEKAQARGCYRNLWLSDPETPVDLSRGPYAAISAVGVIGHGAAPVDLFHDIAIALPARGFFVFSFNDHTLTDPAFEGAVMNCIDGGAFSLLFRENGPHLTGRDMTSTVYILRKR